jgi:inhibitor of cysteine peptidase
MNKVEVADSGEVSMSVGDTVTLRLPENATTGHVWSVSSLGVGLVLEEDRSVPSRDGAPGAAGEHLIKLRADRPGEWRVDLRLAREWEPDALEERQIRVRVGLM